MDYLPVRLSTLPPNVPLGFNIYIKLPHKYILYIFEGDPIDSHRYLSLKNKRLKKLYVVSNDEEKYQSFIDRTLDMAVDTSSKMKSADRANIVTGITTDALNELKENPEKESSFRKTQKAAKSIIGIVGATPDMLKILLEIDAEDDDLFVKSAINTASLTVQLGRALSIPENKLEIIGTAALLRDISLLKLSDEKRKSFYKPYEEFTKDDWNLFKSHPVKSAELLQNKSYVAKEILDVVLRHEEKKSGNGFPNCLQHLSMEEEILSICTTFDRYITILKIPPNDAMKKLNIDDMGNFDLQMINTLKEVWKKTSAKYDKKDVA